MTAETPLVGEPPAEVPLENAPIVGVVAQLRFPPVVSIANMGFIGPFQESIRGDYGELQQETLRAPSFQASSATITNQAAIVWRFTDADHDWRVSLGVDNIALDTGRYTSRDDFLQRFDVLVRALSDHIKPKRVQRLGIRYINRVFGEPADVSGLFRAEVGSVMASPLGRAVQHTVTDSVFALPEDEGMLRTRWGWIPAGATIDPAVVAVADRGSFLLDLDAFDDAQQALDAHRVAQQATAWSKRIYSVFRWAVTDDFLRHHGGQP